MKITCGVYLYNMQTGCILIGHATNTEHAFSIPKGLYDDNDKDYYSAAIRELYEETSIDISTCSIIFQKEFDFVFYKNNKPKKLKPFLICVDNLDGIEIKCTSMFTNKQGVQQPEIDWFKWVTLSDAEEFLPESQIELLQEIKTIIYNINSTTYE